MPYTLLQVAPSDANSPLLHPRSLPCMLWMMCWMFGNEEKKKLQHSQRARSISKSHATSAFAFLRDLQLLHLRSSRLVLQTHLLCWSFLVSRTDTRGRGSNTVIEGG